MLKVSANEDLWIFIITDDLSRRGQSAVLAIDTATMNRDGYEFYQTANHVWLVDNVPPKYLQLLESSFRDRGKF
jgi:RNA:NAD 2'-phosphotransferase (TPT1/KptA family)